MALFSRKSEVAEEVPELERYYAERRTGSAWSWLMALVTMILTILIIIGLFFAGRWAYRELINDDNKSSTNTPAVTSNASGQPATSGSASSAPAESSTQSQQSTGGSVTPVTSSTSATAGQPGTSVANSSTAPSSTLPNSGPETVIAIVLSASLAAYLLTLYRLKKQTIR